MKIYVMDAFSTCVFGGNQAGVVLVEQEFSDEIKQKIAAELKHSETAFVTRNSDGSISLRYFTPAGEVDLCGHATIASFALLHKLGYICDGEFIAHTKASDLNIQVDGDTVWMDMAPPKLIRELAETELLELYSAYGLNVSDRPKDLMPQLITTGLPDIMMPVRDRATLLRAEQNAQMVAKLSQRNNCVGVHMFCLGEGEITAWCSNYAPLYDIPEECATGTSNGALTYYLYCHGLLQPERNNLFLQGEHMNRPSEIRSCLYLDDANVNIRIGGCAVMSLEADIKI